MLLGFVWFFIQCLFGGEILSEATFQGHHTRTVQIGLRYGMLLFIVSEIMFFVAFFGRFFIQVWPRLLKLSSLAPKGIPVLNPWEVPFLNTIILLTSGASVTWAHHALLAGEKQQAIYSLVVTVLLAIAFTSLQVFEYIEAPFTIADGIYGSTFFLATGFHGFHVFVGTVFLGICLVRVVQNHFTKHHHFGFEAAAWYWHFVDVVWLFLFVAIYWWGGN